MKFEINTLIQNSRNNEKAKILAPMAYEKEPNKDNNEKIRTTPVFKETF